MKKKLKKIISLLGPGLITGASDDDPSGISTYSQAGAQFGLSTLWASWVTFPLMAAVQEMCARIGLVTESGLAKTIRGKYPMWVLVAMIVFTFPATVLNIGADIEGMAASTRLLIPIPMWIFSVAYTAIIMFLVIKLPYRKIAAVLKYLCIFLLLYLIVPFLSKQDWGVVLKSAVIPHIQWNKDFISILVAILGTTISPYLFFWQATMEAEDEKQANIIVNKKVISDMDKDVDIGMFFSNLVMFFIILTTGTVLHEHGVKNIETVEQAASALKPLAGKASYILFTLGIVGTGLLSIPVLCGSLSYILSETFNWHGGLDKKFSQAKPFYLVVILSLTAGLVLNWVGLSAVQALIYTAILYGVTSPVLIGIILHIANNKKIMGEYTNGKWSNILGFITLILMTVSAVALLWFQFA
jgi:NRAMP (natural resistance-associated macrophage protein)-like metal ion transporter